MGRPDLHRSRQQRRAQPTGLDDESYLQAGDERYGRVGSILREPEILRMSSRLVTSRPDPIADSKGFTSHQADNPGIRPAECSEFGIPPLRHKCWGMWRALREQPWFSRSWVIQEFAACLDVWVICKQDLITRKQLSRSINHSQDTSFLRGKWSGFYCLPLQQMFSLDLFGQTSSKLDSRRATHRRPVCHIG